MLGLSGLMPDTIDPDTIEPRIRQIREDALVWLNGEQRTAFDERRDMLFLRNSIRVPPPLPLPLPLPPLPRGLLLLGLKLSPRNVGKRDGRVS